MFFALKAQDRDYEVKVVSAHMQTVKGILQKVSKDGLAIQDYKGNYLIFKANDIVRVKVKKRGLTTLKGAGTGALTGVVIGAALLSLEPEDEASTETFKIAAVITACTTASGALIGFVSEIVNTKHNFYINQNTEKFEKKYLLLEKYIRTIKVEHF
ncbi:hypothetical protein [Pedobacter frigoris]|uniref:Uncharacterized protein n=1 Tax=Pedobacter frigoris TaxID=2571272 RepID=A0A4U1CEQ2_9SPHI|nr:hypothetical protein [Pedobacter frigoris]TKC03911.1 hypothetical protein FA047_18330 [Pedobacter frigoris]